MDMNLEMGLRTIENLKYFVQYSAYNFFASRPVRCFSRGLINH